jgi:hypothetical protein
MLLPSPPSNVFPLQYRRYLRLYSCKRTRLHFASGFFSE